MKKSVVIYHQEERVAVRNVILYHGGCPDGAMAAAVVLRALRERGERDVDLVPAAYQRPLSDFVQPERECSACCGLSKTHASPAPGDTSGHCDTCGSEGADLGRAAGVVPR